MNDGIPETKLGGKWAGGGDADIMSLLQLLTQHARQHDLKDTFVDSLIGVGRKMGVADEAMEDELFADKEWGSPVFYVP